MSWHQGKRFVRRVRNERRHELAKCLLAQLATVLLHDRQAWPERQESKSPTNRHIQDGNAG